MLEVYEAKTLEKLAMSTNDKNTETNKDNLEISQGSGFAYFFIILGCLFMVGGLVSVGACSNVSNYSGKKDEYAIFAISCFVLCFNFFFAAHIISILANSRWFLSQIYQKTLPKKSDTISHPGVIDELKKILEQNKKQSAVLRKSIDELSDKTEKTNTYLYHIYKK